METIKTLGDVHRFCESLILNSLTEIPDNVEIRIHLHEHDFIKLIKDNYIKLPICDKFQYNGVQGVKVTILRKKS